MSVDIQVDIECLSLAPFLMPILHPMTPFFLQSPPSDYLFSTFVSNFFRVHFEKFANTCANVKQIDSCNPGGGTHLGMVVQPKVLNTGACKLTTAESGIVLN